MAKLSKNNKLKIAEAFIDGDLLRFGDYKFKSGVPSPIYMDLRKAQSHPKAFHIIVDAYSQMLKGVDPSIYIAGVPEAATSLAAAVGYKLKWPLLQPRKVVKDYGTKSSIEGDFKKGNSVILIDDIITDGGSKFEAIDQVEDAGLKVEKLILLVDYERGGLETLSKKGYSIEAAIGMTELMNMLLELGKVDSDQHRKVLRFIGKS